MQACLFTARQDSKIGPTATDKVIYKLPREQWKIVLLNKYLAYISIGIFDKIQEMLKQNYADYTRNNTCDIPRRGAALHCYKVLFIVGSVVIKWLYNIKVETVIYVIILEVNTVR